MVRIKERYLLVHVIYPCATPAQSHVPELVVYHQPTTALLTPRVLLDGLRSEVGALFGDHGRGVAELGLSVKYLSHATSTFIVRVARAYYRPVWAALACMSHVPVPNGKPCIFRVVHVSGSMKKAEEEAIRKAQQLVIAARNRERRQQ